jgi:hypothetical protein
MTEERKEEPDLRSAQSEHFMGNEVNYNSEPKISQQNKSSIPASPFRYVPRSSGQSDQLPLARLRDYNS